jgi:hypothetical protein
MSEDSSKQIKQEQSKQEQSKQEQSKQEQSKQEQSKQEQIKQVKEARPVMLKQVETKEDGRILYYYSFSEASESQKSEARSVNSEGAKK